jgi:hypothetical protein
VKVSGILEEASGHEFDFNQKVQIVSGKPLSCSSRESGCTEKIRR